MQAHPIAACSWKPTPQLRPYVEEFAFRDQSLRHRRIYAPLSARSDCFLQFYFHDPYRVITVATGGVHLAPCTVLVGPHSLRREDLLLTGHLRMFTIRFSAVGFRALFGIPARLIANYAGPADAVLGRSVISLAERLADVPIVHMPASAEAFLLTHLREPRTARGNHAAARLADTLALGHGSGSIATMAGAHGLGVRQIERLFLEHVGLTPKTFARLARLQHALALSDSAATAQPTSWADLAAAAGFYDQAHMIREFQALNGATPAEFAALRRRAGIILPESSAHVAFVQSGDAPSL